MYLVMLSAVRQVGKVLTDRVMVQQYEELWAR
jgi:hypothetical protein